MIMIAGVMVEIACKKIHHYLNCPPWTHRPYTFL